jgi:FkbM family methyltransferase
VAKQSRLIRFNASETPLPHAARSFADLPDPAQAAALLADLAPAPCAFAPVKAGRPLALYGAGNMGHLARDFLDLVGHAPEMVIDRNAAALAGDAGWAGNRLVAPEGVPAADKAAHRVAVSVVTAPYVPIERALLEVGFADVVPFYDLAESFRDRHPLSNGWFAAPLTAEEEAGTAAVLAGWADDMSRAHHLQFMAWRRLREEWTFDAAPPLPNSERFFTPEVLAALRDDEVFVDAGAYHGDVTRAFVEKTVGQFRQIVAVEPDPASRALLRRSLAAVAPDALVYDVALGAADSEASFHDGLGYASQLSATGCLRAKVHALDSLGLAPTFIKLHLEGGELAALHGAKQTLIAHRPMLAATVYHNADGIFRTAQWLMQTLADYRFMFRLHSWCGTGAVIYAIPDERSAR